ncbi:MAG: GMP synthase [Betaproteobacteria bacterium]|nr:GMP synthase [Betaproteobacteria bacterium]
MKTFLVVQHSYSEFLGLVENQLHSRDIGFVYCRPFAGEALPAGALAFDALWLLGGAFAVDDELHCPWVKSERRLLQSFQRARRPVVGLGFGGLLVAWAAGATPCGPRLHHAYWTTARMAPAGRDDPLAQVVDGRPVLVMHEGTMALPPGIPPLVVDEAGRWLAIRPDAITYGLLFRPEVKPGMIEDMIMEDGRELPDDIGELLEESRRRWADWQATADRVAGALVGALGLMREQRKRPVIALAVRPADKRGDTE